MRVGVDATSVLDELSGAEVHVLTAVDALRRHPAPGEEVVLFVRRRPPAGWEDLPPGWRVVVLPTGSQAVATQVLLPRAAARAGLDVLYCAAKPAPAAYRGPVLTNIHDVIPWSRPGVMGSRRAAVWYRALHRRAVAAGAHVATVSHASAAALRRTLGVAEERLHVVGNAVPPWLSGVAPGPPPAGVAGRRYLLTLARWDPRRDLATVLDAWEKAHASHPDAALVVAGKVGWNVSGGVERARATPGVVLTGEVTNAELAGLYAHAEALVTASLEEGFGLPLVEAFSFATPALASAIPAHREVGGTAAAFFPPGDSAALAKLMADVLSGGLGPALAAAAPGEAARHSGAALAGRLRRALAEAAA